MSKLILVWLVLSCLLTLTPLQAVSAAENNHIVPTVDMATPADIPPTPPMGEGFYEPRRIEIIVIHHSGSFPTADTPEANAWAVAGYKNYHKFSVHPGIYGDQTSWVWRQDANYEWYQTPAQEEHPDGRSYPEGYNVNNIDYHWVVGTDGLVYEGRDERTVGWTNSNWEANLKSLNICFAGAFTFVGPKREQYLAGLDLLSRKMEQYKTTTVYRHSDFTSTDCPGAGFTFDQLVLEAKHWTGIYNDVGFSYWAHDSLSTLGKLWLLSGYADGTLRPENPITRAEAITLLWRSVKMPVSEWFPAFPDTSGHWASTAINWAVANGLVQGYPNGLFLPNGYITRAEFSKIIAIWLKLPGSVSTFADVPVNHWATQYIGAVTEVGIKTGYLDGTFKPDNLSTRAEAFVSVDRSME
jgi:hypothetical protein